MAIPWLTVLQAVPWSDVIRNAPKVADGAKKLWQNVGRTPGAATEAVSTAPGREDPLAALQAQAAAQQTALAELQQQMQSASELIKTLAEQNTGLIRRVEALQLRLRWLAAVLVVLAALATWLLAR